MPLREPSSPRLDLTQRELRKSLEQAELARPGDGLGTRGDAELPEDRPRMCPDRVEGDVELGRDLPLRQAARKQPQDLELALRELPERCRAVSLARGMDLERFLGSLEPAEPVTRVGKRLEEIADTRQ